METYNSRRFSNNVELNDLCNNMLRAYIDSIINDMELVVDNYLLGKSREMASMNFDLGDLSRINLKVVPVAEQSDNLNFHGLFDIFIERLASCIKSIEEKDDIDNSDEEPSLQAMRVGLNYSGNNDSSYNKTPSPYILSRY